MTSRSTRSSALHCIRGTFVVPNPITRSISLEQDHIIAYDNDTGTILYFGAWGSAMTQAFLDQQDSLVRITELGSHEFITPGLVDTHIHAPQYSYSGTATDKSLMNWLQDYTFPAERALRDLNIARSVYEEVVQCSLRHGTTTAMYYATLDVEPTKVLCDVIIEKQQRGLVGKVCMDRNAPEDYVQTLEENVKGTKEIIEYIHNFEASKNNMIFPVVTPRFYPTCTFELLQRLGQVARDYDCHIQSHVSESLDEVAFSHDLDSTLVDSPRSGVQIFEAAKCLTNKTVLAHGIYVNTHDAALLRRFNAGISHCPLSNFYFAGGMLRTKYLTFHKEIKVGIGTDIAGGYSPSMWHACRCTVMTSRALWQLQYHSGKNDIQISENNKQNVEITNEEGSKSTMPDEVLDYKEALYLATLGGAELLQLDHIIGTFKQGMQFDAIHWDTRHISLFERDTIEDEFQKLCCLGDDRNIRCVYINGSVVHRNPNLYPEKDERTY